MILNQSHSKNLALIVLIFAMPDVHDNQDPDQEHTKESNAIRKLVRRHIQLSESNEWLQFVHEYLAAVQENVSNRRQEYHIHGNGVTPRLFKRVVGKVLGSCVRAAHR